MILSAAQEIHFRLDEFQTFSFSQQGVKLEALPQSAPWAAQHAQISSCVQRIVSVVLKSSET